MSDSVTCRERQLQLCDLVDLLERTVVIPIPRSQHAFLRFGFVRAVLDVAWCKEAFFDNRIS